MRVQLRSHTSQVNEEKSHSRHAVWQRHSIDKMSAIKKLHYILKFILHDRNYALQIWQKYDKRCMNS